MMYFMWEFFIFDLDKVLMGTGALQSSYISKDLVDKHRDAWRGKVVQCDGNVRGGRMAEWLRPASL